MSCSIVKVNGEPNSTLLMEYIMDSEADVSSLPVNVADGSFSYTKDLSCIYVFKGGSWVKANGIEVDPDAIAEAVADWLDDHPEATTTVQDGAISYAKLNSSLQGTVDDVGDLKTDFDDLSTATSLDVGKALSPKTVTNGKVTEWQYKAIGGGGGGGAVEDVQIDGTSIVDGDGVANVPVASDTTFGAVKLGAFGVTKFASGPNKDKLCIECAGAGFIKSATDQYRPIVSSHQHESTFYGLAKAAGADMASVSGATVGTYTDAAKSAISQMLNGSVSVTGTTPSITALPGIRYVCGECATLAITLPVSGIVDVVFASGSTPTVLTVTPPTGVSAVKWAGGFDPTSLDANTTYEINVMDGEFGVVGAWT